MKETSILNHFLKTTFSVEGSSDYESVKRVLNHPNFPNREKEFKEELVNAILKQPISTEEFEKLTDIDFETQDEIREYLLTEIWQPLYGDEPVKA